MKPAKAGMVRWEMIRSIGARCELHKSPTCSFIVYCHQNKIAGKSIACVLVLSREKVVVGRRQWAVADREVGGDMHTHANGWQVATRTRLVANAPNQPTKTCADTVASHTVVETLTQKSRNGRWSHRHDCLPASPLPHPLPASLLACSSDRTACTFSGCLAVKGLNLSCFPL